MPNLFSNRIKKEKLKPGDHIYYWSGILYSHHGIYIGEESVIHYVRGNASKSISSASSSNYNPSTERGGVILTTLNEFLKGKKLYLYVYDASDSRFLFKRGGTCTIDYSDSADVVIKRAQYLLHHGIGSYDLFENNCENFAVYCKTGRVDPMTGEIGTSGQVTSNALAIVGVFNFPLMLGLRHRFETDRIEKCEKVPVENLENIVLKQENADMNNIFVIPLGNSSLISFMVHLLLTWLFCVFKFINNVWLLYVLLFSLV